MNVASRGEQKDTRKYTFEECYDEAKTYDTKTLWRLNGNTYRFASKKGWLKQIYEKAGFTSGGKHWWFKI